MTTWIIGDIQGYYDAMMNLLDKVDFDPNNDYLWSVGDLVNRGNQSAQVLRFCKSLGEHFLCTLGNHDLHLLAVARGYSETRRHDSFDDVIDAPDSDDLLNWLQQQPLVHYDQANQLLLSHAGIAPMWSIQQSLDYASEVTEILRSNELIYGHYFTEMYGNNPDRWHDSLTDASRWRTITNYLTRMRFINNEGVLNMDIKGGLERTDKHWKPWFQLPHQILDNDNISLVIGHWAALEGVTHHPKVEALDTGYSWGGTLTLMNASTKQRVYYRHQ